MGNLSEDESSSDSSSNEFLVPADQLDFNSSFFQVPAKKEDKKKTPNSKAKQNSAKKPTRVITHLESSSDNDDEFDYNQDDNQVSSTELLSQVLKNLENANKQCQPLVGESKPLSSTFGSVQSAKDDLSKEINDLLIIGESQASTSKVDMEICIKQEDVKEEVKSDSYVIPEKGVQIHLQGESLMIDKKKKKQQDLQKLLQNKINQRIRNTQMYAHKVGLLCWLAHGFCLNNLANDPDLLGITLSLVSLQNYPKDKLDLKYLEKFTIWFSSMFKMCDEYKDVIFNKDLLIKRVTEKKIFNYIELILLYLATVRGMGMLCRLVISLQPPRLKPKQDQLFKIPASEDTKNVKKEDDDEDDDEMENVTDEPTSTEPAKRIKKDTREINEKSSKKKITKKPAVHKSVKAAAGIKKLKTKKKSVSPTKVIPQNSPEAIKAAREEAKKKAAAILKEKTVNPANNYVVIIEDSKSLEDFSRKLNKTQQSKNLKETKDDKINYNDEVKEKGKNINVNETTFSRNMRSKKNLNKAKNDIDSDDEKEGKTINEQKSTSNLINKRTRRNFPNKNLASTEDINDNSEKAVDKKGEKNMSIAKKLSLKVKEKKETILNNNKSKNNKSKIRNKSTRQRKHSHIYKEVSDNEKEKDFSSEYSANEKSDSSVEEFSSDYEYEEMKPKRRNITIKNVKKKESTSNKAKIDKSALSAFIYKSKNPRKLLSSDDESPETGKKGYNVWVEVYVESEESWICVNILDQKVHSISTLFKKASQPVHYIVAWNSAGTVKDVTRRYCPHWLTDTRKKRVDEKWWKETLKPWKEKCSAMSRAEDEQLLQRELEQPLPKSVSECKGHPLYVLQRHLLKFEALYPPDVVPLGHLKTGEAIYSRHCVHTLYSRETWVKRARVVKPAQEAYKIVKSMPKYDKLSGQKIKNQPLELFGKWQTTAYEPPVAKDGIVPRNEYGNVDLFKMCMLPKGCVYIDLPALNRTARKLNIDCAPACVGFNFGCRGALPAFQGFVVCEEYEDTLREAWEEEQVLAQKRATEKREKRVYGNWKKLIKGLLIREKLAAKYSFRDKEESSEEKDEDEEEQERVINKKSVVKKVAAATSTKSQGKRGRPKQEPRSVIKKLKK